MPLSPIEQAKVDEWDQMIDVNLRGVLHGMAAVLPYMKAQKFGHLITTASVAAYKTFPAQRSTARQNSPSAHWLRVSARR